MWVYSIPPPEGEEMPPPWSRAPRAEAEGCFTCSIIDKPTNGGLVRLRYILSQKGNYDQMKYLADMLNGKTHYLKSYSGYNMTVNTTKLGLVIKYFDLYPLKTKKHIVYFN